MLTPHQDNTVSQVVQAKYVPLTVKFVLRTGGSCRECARLVLSVVNVTPLPASGMQQCTKKVHLFLLININIYMAAAAAAGDS
jgi:hypothetical protein